MSRSEDHPYSDEETSRRRDVALLRALSTPHKRQADLKVGKPKPESGGEASPKKRGRTPRTKTPT